MNNRNTIIGAGAAVVALVAIGGFFLLRGEEPAAGASPSPWSSVAASAMASASVSPEPTLNEELLGSRLTVLLLGTDSNEGRRNREVPVNADAILLVSVNADQSEVTLVSLPRDTTNIPMPDGSTWQRKVNGIYGEQGAEGMVAALESLFEVPIDAYAEIDMDDIVAVVDAVDGVTVAPEAALDDDHLGFRIAAGEQEIDGEKALGYVRTRVDLDYGRAARQQEVLLELARRFTDPDTDIDVARLLDGLRSFRTTLPLDDLPTIVEIARRAQDAEVTRQVLGPPEFITFEGDRGDGRGYILEPDIEAMRAFVAAHIGEGGP